MQSQAQLKLRKRLRERFIRKHGYDKKIIIDDIVDDFLQNLKAAPDSNDINTLSKFIEKRLSGRVSMIKTRLSDVNYKQEVVQEEIRKREAEQEHERKISENHLRRKEIRDKHRPVSLRKARKVPQVPIPSVKTNRTDEPAGIQIRRSLYQKRHYHDRPITVAESGRNYLKETLDRQVEEKQAQKLREAVNKKEERLKMRVAEFQRLEDEKTAKLIQMGKAKSELLRMSEVYRLHQSDLRMHNIRSLQQEFLSEYENMNPFTTRSSLGI